MRILLVEDEKGLGEAIREHIASEGHAVDWFETVSEASASVATTAYDLILLDLLLPDGNGLNLLTQIRAEKNNVAVLILSALDQISDRIKGLNAGADGYLVKPFDLGELSARIIAIQRRLYSDGVASLSVGDLTIDVANKIILNAGVPANLSAREWAVLERLLRHKNSIVAKSVIEDALYEYGAEVESNTVEVYISRLRKKIGKTSIETIRGIGYRMKV